jgi:hypothetical protein
MQTSRKLLVTTTLEHRRKLRCPPFITNRPKDRFTPSIQEYQEYPPNGMDRSHLTESVSTRQHRSPTNDPNEVSFSQFCSSGAHANEGIGCAVRDVAGIQYSHSVAASSGTGIWIFPSPIDPPCVPGIVPYIGSTASVERDYPRELRTAIQRIEAERAVGT